MRPGLPGLLGRLPRLRRAAPKGHGAAPSPLRLAGADWAWRPEAWAGAAPGAGPLPAASGVELCGGVRLFHDAEAPELRIERPAIGPQGAWPLQLCAKGFDGSFLSLAIALPEAALARLERRHLLGIDVDLGPEGASRSFARLNLRQGPNSEALLRSLPMTEPTGTEFDLWSIETAPDRVETGWIDLIFEAPLPMAIEIRDLVIARRPRASF